MTKRELTWVILVDDATCDEAGVEVTLLPQFHVYFIGGSFDFLHGALRESHGTKDVEGFLHERRVGQAALDQDGRLPVAMRYQLQAGAADVLGEETVHAVQQVQNGRNVLLVTVVSQLEDHVQKHAVPHPTGRLVHLLQKRAERESKRLSLKFGDRREGAT